MSAPRGRGHAELAAHVTARVAEIAAAAHDPEKAHALEDALYVDVLCRIAAGCADPESLATEALRARRVRFGRWMA